ncbi:MAG: RHS repeat-associated core domain-containing protein [Bacteroidota bacterium]
MKRIATIIGILASIMLSDSVNAQKATPCLGGAVRYYRDLDGDGVGNTSDSMCVCDGSDPQCIGLVVPGGGAPAGYVLIGGDCDDTNASYQYNRVWYPDNDGDGFGDAQSSGILACVPPPNHVIFALDCDDNDPNITILYNVYYSDADGDGLGNPNVFLTNQCTPPAGYVTNSDDECPNEYGIFSNGCNYESINWISSKSYDVAGNVIASGKTYFDDLGKPIQAQTVNIKTGDTWANSTVYDNQGRAALQTLTAPIDMPANVDFMYQPDFIRKTNGNTYASADFETDVENPEPVGNQSGSLGWYYDEVNTNEPFQDVTDYPFTRTIFSTLNPGDPLKTIGGNKISVDGQPEAWISGFSYTVPAAQELYYAFGKGYFGQEGVVENSEIVNTKFFKTVSIDVHGVETVVFTDNEGKTLAAARSGGDTKYEVVSIIGEQNYVDVHIPTGIVNSDITFLTSQAYYKVYDLRTEQLVSTSQMTGGNFYRIEYIYLNPLGDIEITSSGDINTVPSSTTPGIRYKVNYYDYTLNYYDKAGRLIESTQPLGFDEMSFDLTVETPDHVMRSTFTYNALGEVLEANKPDEGTTNFIYREDGQIRFSQNSEQANNNEFSYTHYDARGRPVESGVYEGPLSFGSVASRTVTLTGQQQIKQEGNRISKIGVPGWNAGLATIKKISGNGYVQARFPDDSDQRTMFGLSATNANSSYNTIGYAIYGYEGGIYVYESGTSRGSFGNYTSNDVLKVERVGSTIYYKKNNSTFYTSTIQTSADLLGDVSLYNPEAQILDFELGGNVILPSGISEYVYETNVTVNGNTISKDSGNDSQWDTGLKTRQTIESDGSISFRGSQTNEYLMVGLSKRANVASVHFIYIDYAIYLVGNGNFQVYEHGGYVGNFGTYTPSDTFKVERIGNMVRYLKNGIIFYTSDLPSFNEDLLGAVSLRSVGAAVNNVTLSGSDYKFTDYSTTRSSRNTLRKIGGLGWSSGFASIETITGDGYVQFTAPVNTHHYMIGLSETNTNANYNTIDFALYVNRNQRVYVYESGMSIGQVSTYESGDVFKVERTGPSGTIKYYKNDQVIYTSTATSTAPLLIDASISGPSSYIENLGLYDLVDAANVVTETTYLNPNDCRERHRTRYDMADLSSLASALNAEGISSTHYATQNFIAGKVSKTYTLNPYTSRTWYSYDIYGRVEWLVQEINGLGTKTIDYEYDPVNGLVAKVIFQKHVTSERYVHKYDYNTAGELTALYTSVDNQNFTLEARYSYYETGALKRVELVKPDQGIDYVYNLAGRLKAINHPSLAANNDPGGDSNDAFGMHIDYYTGDYKRTNTPKPIVTSTDGENRYDGNIKATRWGTKMLDNNPEEIHNGYLYKYNKNKWLTEAEMGRAANTGSITPFSNKDYKVAGLTYDSNGNLLSLDRQKKDVGSGNNMDNFTYNYNASTNQLNYVHDIVPPSNEVDLDAQLINNYEYNSIGQMIKNNQDNLGYSYNSNGLVSQIQKSGSPAVNYDYNDRRHRVLKESSPDGNTWYQTYYVRDASGQVMAIYQGSYGNINSSLQAVEYPIYGSSRHGIFNRPTSTSNYQLTDHLGNVRAVVNNYEAVTNYTDYYPFGMPLPLRNLQSGYRYGYQGDYAEKEEEFEGSINSFELRLWDSRIGRWTTTDPAGQYHSPYLGMGNNPINGIDPDGAWVPDENGNLVAEEGDNASTLAVFLNTTEAAAQKMIDDQGLLIDYTNSPGTSLMEYQVLTLDNAYTRAIANSSGDLTLDKFLTGTSVTGKVPEDDYNCWGSACAGSRGYEINVTTARMGSPYTFDATLTSHYSNTDPSGLKFGETIIRFSNGSVATHAAVYYGTSKDGTIYTFTKNGWDVKPEIMKLSRFSSEPILRTTYGPIKGMLSVHTGFYNPR